MTLPKGALVVGREGRRLVVQLEDGTQVLVAEASTSDGARCSTQARVAGCAKVDGDLTFCAVDLCRGASYN